MRSRDLCRMTRKRMTMSAPSKKSVIRRRKKGHFTANDLSYHTFICVVHQASIGLRDDDVATSATEDPAVDISFIESIFFDASKLVVVCRIRIIDESVDLAFVCSGNISQLATFLLGENPWTKCKRSVQRNSSKPIAIFSL
jgi:hypothetical protein